MRRLFMIEDLRALARSAPVQSVLLAITAGLAYWNSLQVPFIFDDLPGIVENPSIRDWQAYGAVLFPPDNGSSVTGRPLVNLTLALNYAWAGMDPSPYHTTNVLLHIGCTLALWGCLRRGFTAPALSHIWNRSYAPLATLCAAVWSLHPLQTESVTCVIQRTELLVGLFYLATIYAFIRATEGDRTRFWTVCAAFSCAMGMASKEVMVSAPVVALFYDRLINRVPILEALKVRRGLYLSLAVSWLLLGALVLGMGGTRGEAAGFGTGAPWWAYSLKQCEAILLYLQLSVWPNPLVLYYGVDLVYSVSSVMAELAILIVAIALTGWGLWRGHPLTFAAIWFFALLAPSSSVVPLVSQTVSEHRMYLPLAGPLVAVMAWLHIVLGRRLLLSGAGIAAAFVLLVAARNRDYASELSIWNDTVAKAPNNARARVNFGAALKAAGKIDAARVQYEKAVALDPTSAEAQNNLATILIGLGRWEEAIPRLEQAIALRPRLAEAHINLAAAMLHRNDPTRAIHHAREAVRLKPESALAHSNHGYAALRLGDHPAALAAFTRAAALDPRFAEARSTLGGLLYQAGRIEESVTHFEAAVVAEPGSVTHHNNVASAYAQLGRLQEAIAHYRIALRLNPGFLESYLNLALILSRTGDFTAARAALEEADRLKPNDQRVTTLRAQITAAEQRSPPDAPTPRN